MRQMSFAKTTRAIILREKTVTRRLGWVRLQPDTLLQPIVQGQGLTKGAHVRRLGRPVRVVSVRRERLDALLEDRAYGWREVLLEGFQGMTPGAFVAMYCQSFKVPPTTVVTRIEFAYTDRPRRGIAHAVRA